MPQSFWEISPYNPSFLLINEITSRKCVGHFWAHTLLHCLSHETIFKCAHIWTPYDYTRDSNIFYTYIVSQNILYHKPDIVLVHKLEQALNI